MRPGFFFENLLWQMDSIRNWGRISLPLSGSTRYPMLATRDIGRVAATRLTNADWSGQVVQELHGPADLSFREVAEILAQVLGRKIVYIKCDRLEMRDIMLKNAMSENAADLDAGVVRRGGVRQICDHAAALARNHHLHHVGRVRPRGHPAAGNRAGGFAT